MLAEPVEEFLEFDEAVLVLVEVGEGGGDACLGGVSAKGADQLEEFVGRDDAVVVGVELLENRADFGDAGGGEGHGAV